MDTLLSDLDTLSANGQQQHFAAGEIIFAEGDAGNELYVLTNGRIDIVRDGNHIDELSGRTVMGEMALVDSGTRSASAVAATDCTVIAIDRQHFASILRNYPGFAIDVMAIMASRLRRLTRQEVERQKVEHELEIGRKIQLSLLPEYDPELPGWRIASHYQAAQQVGGDMYDYVQAPAKPDELNVIIADVTGKGVPAAMFMAVARTMLRSETRNGSEPAQTLSRVNDLVVADGRTPLFLTALCASISSEHGQMTYASAGHEAPVLRQRSTGRARFLPARGMVLGAFPNITYAQEQTELAAGDLVVFYTDGVTEARNVAGQFFGEQRLLDTVSAAQGQDAAGLVSHLVTAVADFSGALPQADDLTVVVVERVS